MLGFFSFQMVLSPVFRMNESGDGVTRVRGHSQAQPAVTKYRVLDSCSGCSLVELQPLTGDNIEPLENVSVIYQQPVLS